MNLSSGLPAVKAGRALILPRTICFPSNSPVSLAIDSPFRGRFAWMRNACIGAQHYASEHAFAVAALQSIRLGDRSI